MPTDDIKAALAAGADLIRQSQRSSGPTPDQQAAALDREKAATFNPSSADGVAGIAPARQRIPLSVPRRKLQVQPIPGFVLYWFKESNTFDAINAGYDFVDSQEVRLNQTNEANSADTSGNTDLGSRVSVIGDRMGEHGRPERLILMKIREDWWREDRKLLDNENAAVIEAIFGGQILGAQSGADHSQSYVRNSVASGSGKLFNRGLKKIT